ncbi:sensor histidine kinase [Paraclostridium bifermentans]|uniref:sensor histidine kinase n=1 Tax=Paraclostridium bifermentans TaxID=1490 RepID=UPI0024BABFA7|nr:sensor histidine kinase [Paraclostridium bifermentans]
MSLMELIIKVAKVKFRDLTAFTINTLIILLFYFLFFKDSEIVYPLMLSGFIMAVYFIIEVVKYREFSEKLNDTKKSPNYKVSDLSANEEEVLNIISEIHSDYIKQIYGLNQQISDRNILFSQWIHNMKTSVTVIGLACEKSSLSIDFKSCINDIEDENNILKKNLEECLNILRVDDFSRDYIINSCNLNELVNIVVNSKKRDFIYKGVYPKVNIDKDIYVYTDRKWVEYMLGQIISNSIKYSNDKVEISAKNNINNTIELLIKDNGIGISKEDLPRVFDPFFTGSNGRRERSATGIGLYMVKVISKKLGHSIEIESEFEYGTSVKITFKSEEVI